MQCNTALARLLTEQGSVTDLPFPSFLSELNTNRYGKKARLYIYVCTDIQSLILSTDGFGFVVNAVLEMKLVFLQ